MRERTPRVTARLTVSPETAGAPLANLVAFATELAGSALRVGLAPGTQVTQMACQAALFEPLQPGDYRGEPTALHLGAANATWQVMLLSSTGTRIATVTLSFALGVPNAPELPPAIVGRDSVRQLDAAEAASRRRDVIAAAASEVIARKGFANATMREIADAAGMHVPTMYQYVSSKDEMLELVYSWSMARLRTDVAEATANCRTAAAKLAAVVGSLIDKGDRYRSNAGVLNRELKSLSPPARARVLEDYGRLRSNIAGLVREGIANGEFRPVDAELAANFIEAICDIWPLRQFAVGSIGREAFRAAALMFLSHALEADAR